MKYKIIIFIFGEKNNSTNQKQGEREKKQREVHQGISQSNC